MHTFLFVAWLLVAQAAGGPMPEPTSWLFQIADRYGLQAALVVFFIGWSYLREKQLNADRAALEAFVRDKLVDLLERATAAIEKFTERK